MLVHTRPVSPGILHSESKINHPSCWPCTPETDVILVRIWQYWIEFLFYPFIKFIITISHQTSTHPNTNVTQCNWFTVAVIQHCVHSMHYGIDLSVLSCVLPVRVKDAWIFFILLNFQLTVAINLLLDLILLVRSTQTLYYCKVARHIFEII